MRWAIPKKAVKTLVEHCNKVGEKTGRSGAEVLRDYLRWMKKYADYFFSSAWPAKPLPPSCELWLSSEEDRFLDKSRRYKEEVERFTVVLLKRNLSLEGFGAEHFDSEFDFYGRLLCYGCAVPDAMHLREFLKKLEESNAEIAEKRKLEPNDPFWAQLYDYRFSAESLRMEKMKRAELGFLEVEGGAEGKVCAPHNKCLCPYGAKSWELIKLGEMVKSLWDLVEFYDSHWNGSRSFTPSRSDTEWYHFGEVGFLNVTSREDILNALEDGRMEKVADEFKRYRETIDHS